MKRLTQARKAAIVASEVPYVEMFGVDGRGRGRPTGDGTLVVNAPAPNFLDAEVARKIAGKAHIRASTVLRALHKEEFEKIYDKEVAHLSRKYVLSLKEESNATGTQNAN